MTEAGQKRGRKRNCVSTSASPSFVSTSLASDAEPTQPEITSSHPAPGGSYITARSSRLAAAFSSALEAPMRLLVPFCPRPLPLRPFLIASATPCKRGRKCFPARGESLLSQTSAKSQHAVASFTKRRTHVHAHTHTHTRAHAWEALPAFPKALAPWFVY